MSIDDPSLFERARRWSYHFGRHVERPPGWLRTMATDGMITARRCALAAGVSHRALDEACEAAMAAGLRARRVLADEEPVA